MFDNQNFNKFDRQDAAQWAANLLSNPTNWAILDTETTGFSQEAEIVQLSVLSPDGTTLLDTLVKPEGPIDPSAQDIHKITPEMLADAPTFPQIFQNLLDIVSTRRLVIYNAKYDLRIINQCIFRNLLAVPIIHADCAMLWYSQWVGEWNQRNQNYKWQKLPGGDHTALGDCRAVLKLIHQMSGQPQTPFFSPILSDKETLEYKEVNARVPKAPPRVR